MDLGLAGSAVVITGGTEGMGKATAECFAREGARVAVLARRRSALDDTAAALTLSGCAGDRHGSN
jgi:NAD(P)-dependent dehydrogenase (short-subunit alcohol dehydrogenase family)